MSFQDKTLQCADCGAEFTFTAREQEFYASKGFTNEPKRCPSDNGYGAPRQMFTAICANCGKETQVPFEPTNGRPVYCSDCYSKVKMSR